MPRIMEQYHYCERVRMYLSLRPGEFTSWMINMCLQYQRAGYTPFWAAWRVRATLVGEVKLDD